MRDASSNFAFRRATAADSERIAALHAASWRAAYRGLLSDVYLDGIVVEERQAVWRDRLDHPTEGQVVILAEVEGGALAGFACAFAASTGRTGSQIDNLHAAPDCRGLGLGRALIRAVADVLRDMQPRCPVSLHVIEGNHAARAFYDRFGGDAVERGHEPGPDGSDVAVLTYTWLSPAALLERTAAGSPQATNGPLR